MVSEKELVHMQELLGRHPTVTELAMLEYQWSEEASYKSTKRWFHLLDTEGHNVVVGIGEGAGVVDLGDDVLLGVAIRAYNGPAADCYESSAKGVGRVIGNVLSQGCSPMALLDSVRVGNIEMRKQAKLLARIVQAVSDYGNSVGVPVIGGESDFDDSYSDNYILNLACIGESSPEKIIRSAAKSPGDSLVLFGVNIHRSIRGERGKKEYCVVQRDLIEALELLRDRHLVSGLQDVGAGGILSAAGEMAQRAGTGVRIEADKIPAGENASTISEVLLSENPERLLASVSPANLELVLEILETCHIPCNVIGKVSDDTFFTVAEEGQIKAEIPIEVLMRGFDEPMRLEEQIPEQSLSHEWLKAPEDYSKAIMDVLSSVGVCDRSWIFRQFDQHSQLNTVVDIGENAGVVEFSKGKLVAVATDCNSVYTKLDPYSGAANSACETLRNLVSVGARPLLVADCLNFGNPEKPEAYAQLVESIRGIGQFSRDFGIPVVAGSISLYNEQTIEGTTKRISPTPQILMAGLIPPGQQPIRRSLCTPLANLYLVGETHRELNGSQYQRISHGRLEGLPPAYSPVHEKNSMNAILEARERGIIRSCNNLGKGGLAVALMKMVFKSNYGFRITVDKVPGTAESLTGILFSESSGRYIVEVTETNESEFLRIAQENDADTLELGLTTFEQMANFGKFKINIEMARRAFKATLPSLLG
ncbi:MAG: hypothetical protein EAX95_15530 [Candidatus Thorarchaeota archaeon]|nr:hypothetical protein [Candidatus Thorarchaeota archaeon]